MGSWIVRAHDIYNKNWDKVTERTNYSYETVAKYIKEIRKKTDKEADSTDIAC